MKKPPGVFTLLASAVTGFSSHVVNLCSSAWSRLLAPTGVKRRPGKR
jgi:hypothetical protein